MYIINYREDYLAFVSIIKIILMFLLFRQSNIKSMVPALGANLKDYFAGVVVSCNIFRKY